MDKKNWIIIILTCFVVGYFLVSVVASPNDPAEFGNLTVTNVWIGGSTGNITCLGNLSADSPTFFVNSNTNRVGIGTASPSGLLDVTGSVASTEIDSSGVRMLFTRAGTHYFDAGTAGGQFSFVVNANADAAASLFLKSNGYVGIGTTNPGNKLEVLNGSIYVHGASGGQGRVIMQLDGADMFEWYPQATGLFLYDRTANEYRLTVLNDGKVGVGETSPDAKLHVYAGASGATPFAGINMVIEDNSTNILQFLSPNTSVNAIMFGDPEHTYSGYIRYSHADDSMRLYTTGTEKFTILTDGKVGIGQTVPSQKLDVVGNIEVTGYVSYVASLSAFDTTLTNSLIYNTKGTGGAYPFQHYGHLVLQSRPSGATRDIVFVTGNAPTVRMIVDAGGNIGIGTDNPIQLLHLDSASTVIRFDHSTTNFGYVGRAAAIITGGGNDELGIRSATDILFSSGLSEKMRITSAGNVGIGTTTPGEELHINSSASSNAIIRLQAGANTLNSIIQFADNADVNPGVIDYDHNDNSMDFKTNDAVQMTILSDGKVGMGTVSPSADLEVIGNILIQRTGAHLYFNETDTSKQWHIEVSGSDLKIVETGVANAMVISPGGAVDVVDDFSADDYYSGDGTQGMTSTCGGVSTVKDGLTTSCTSTLYWTCSGNHFDAQYPDSDDVIKYTSGKIYASANAIIFVASISLPNGATITNVIVNGDAAAGAETWSLNRVTLTTGANSILAGANINTADTTISTPTVDNTLYAYNFYTSSLDTGDEIYGAKITYTI